MEIELKYSIEDDSIIKNIMEDQLLASAVSKDLSETLAMHAVYFDTEQADLRKNHIAFRVRLEGDSYVATIKIGGSAVDGLHKREELNAPVTDEKFIKNPDLSIFSGNKLIDDIASRIGDNRLIPVMEMNFAREAVKIDYNGSIIEASIDQGDIITANATCPICELELELYSGSENDLIELGRQLQQTYSLREENTSKYARGLALLESE